MKRNGEPVLDRNGQEIFQVRIEDTEFMHWPADHNGNSHQNPNFMGIETGKFRSKERKADILINEDLANILRELEISVYENNPEDPLRKYYSVAIKLSDDFRETDEYGKRRRPPVIHFCSNGKTRKLNLPDELHMVDYSRIKSICVDCKTYRKDPYSNRTLWIDTMYVEQDVEPQDEWHDRFYGRNDDQPDFSGLEIDDYDEPLPFN